MVLAEGSTPDEAVSLSLMTRPRRDGGRGGVERARLDWDFKPDGRDGQGSVRVQLCCNQKEKKEKARESVTRLKQIKISKSTIKCSLYSILVN